MKHVLFRLSVVLVLLFALSCRQAVTKPADAEPTPQPGPVFVTTDQTEYKPGETVVISITNGLDVPVWYARHLDCGLPFWRLETCTADPIVSHMLCLWEIPQHGFTKLEPGETLMDEWNGMTERQDGFGPADSGCYRVAVPYFADGVELVDTNWPEGEMTAYSSEWVVKKGGW